MRQYEMTTSFEIKVAKNGKITQAMMKKVLILLHGTKKEGTYFLTDSNGACTCWDYSRNREEAEVSCEITSDDLDRYNQYKAQLYRGKLDHEFAEYESYSC